MTILATNTPASAQLPGTYTCRRCGIVRRFHTARPRTHCMDCAYYTNQEAA